MVQCWEEAEYEDGNPKRHRKDIDTRTPPSWQMERTPHKGLRVRGIVQGVAGADAASHAAIEEEGFRDDVGCVEGGDTQRDDAVEGD